MKTNSAINRYIRHYSHSIGIESLLRIQIPLYGEPDPGPLRSDIYLTVKSRLSRG